MLMWVLADVSEKVLAWKHVLNLSMFLHRDPGPGVDRSLRPEPWVSLP